jgi:hypothetical protein
MGARGFWAYLLSFATVSRYLSSIAVSLLDRPPFESYHFIKHIKTFDNGTAASFTVCNDGETFVLVTVADYSRYSNYTLLHRKSKITLREIAFDFFVGPGLLRKFILDHGTYARQDVEAIFSAGVTKKVHDDWKDSGIGFSAASDAVHW